MDANLAQKFNVYGKIAWLWSNSPLHQSWSISLQTNFVLPAIELNQYEIIEDENGLPLAYCSWAWLSPESEEKFILDTNSLDIKDWDSGDRLWFIDWVSPFTSKATWQLQKIIARYFPNHLGRAIRVKDSSKQARVMHFVGNNLSKKQAQQMQHAYYEELLERLKKNPQFGDNFDIAQFFKEPTIDYSI